jgi:hypothetical protein
MSRLAGTERKKSVRKATANWNLRKVDLSFPYVRVLVRGRPEHREAFPKHPPMDCGHRAKIFAPFDALDGFSAMIRQKDRLCEETVREKTDGDPCAFREDL